MQIDCLYKSFTIQMSQVYIRELSSSVVVVLCCVEVYRLMFPCDAVLVFNWINSIDFRVHKKKFDSLISIRFINNSNNVNDNKITYSH